MKLFLKDPDAVLDYAVDWTSWLVGSDDISASTWTVDAGISVESDSHDGYIAKVVVSGGTVGAVYKAVNHIVTTEGLEDDRTILFRIVEK